MGKITFSEKDINNIIDKYTIEKKSQQEIANYYKVSKGVIKRVLTENNVYIRNLKDSNQKIVSEDIRQQIIDNYVIKRMGLVSAGKQFNCSQKVVETILKDAGVKKRTYTEAKQNQRIYTINDNFFKTQSEDMAYILGFIAADGCVAKKENAVHIQLHQKDSEILEKIKEKINSNKPLDFYTTKAGRQTVRLSFWSAEIKKDLEKYNIIPNKTFVLKPPYFLDSKYYKDYIRGYFDGDGSISCKGNDFKTCSWEIIGASKEMIQWIREYLATNFGIINSGILSSVTENNVIMYKTSYYGIDRLKRIYNNLYDENSLCLNKKKETILKYIHETS